MSSIHTISEAVDFMNTWRVNVSSQSWTIERVPELWERLGRRELLARILVDEVPADCDPPRPKE